MYKRQVNGYMRIITAATTPVLFSALSRCQSNDTEFRMTFFKFQRLVSVPVSYTHLDVYKRQINDSLISEYRLIKLFFATIKSNARGVIYEKIFDNKTI